MHEENTSANDNLPQPKGWLVRLADKVLHGTVRLVFKTFFRGKVKGLENLKGLEGKPVVIVANHTSYLDPLMIASLMPHQPTPVFAIDGGVHGWLKKKYNIFGRAFLKTSYGRDLSPVDRNNIKVMSQAIRGMTRLVKSGQQPVVVFPEGRLTKTGTFMKIEDGASTVADSADAVIVPIYLEGMNFVSRLLKRLPQFPGHFFPKLSMTILPPQKLGIPDDVTGKARRTLRLAKLEQIMQSLPVKSMDMERTLIEELHLAAKNFGYRRKIIEDGEGAISYGRLLKGAYALGAKISDLTKKSENVGLLLPNSNGAAVAFFGMQAYGRVPAMLNAKAEIADMQSYTRTASLKTIVTSHRFVKLAGLESKIEALSGTCKIVYLEDLKKKISLPDKMKASLQAHRFWRAPKDRISGKDPAVVLFTSGSEGSPKGVVLSSCNILANIAQTSAVVPLMPNDKIFNVMPVFHSFGLTGGMILPLMKGVSSYQYPTPLDGKEIPKLIDYSEATIMFGTDTFLNLYAHNATAQDMSGLRMIFAGAERLSDETYDMYWHRFGKRIETGYGMTEAAPLVSLNTPHAHQKGSVGKFLPGVEARLEPVEDIPNGFRLFVRGPNIMLGYLKYDNPGEIEAPKDGWHDTGDIVSVNPEGYVTLTGRAKRFAKVGAEMVSLDTVEMIARTASLKKDAAHATVLQQDAEGDRIILFTTDPDIKLPQLAKAAGETGRSALGLPKNADIRVIPAMPLLPTGKTNYTALKKILATPVVSDNAAAPDFNNASGKKDTAPAPVLPSKKSNAPRFPQP